MRGNGGPVVVGGNECLGGARGTLPRRAVSVPGNVPNRREKFRYFRAFAISVAVLAPVTSPMFLSVLKGEDL